MKVLLLYPPFMDPRAPQLALPSLAAFLRRESIEVSLHDLALEGLLWLTRTDSIAVCHRLLTRRGASDILPSFERASELAPWALNTLRSSTGFHDAREFLAARDVLSTILRAHGLARGEEFHASLDPIEYRIRGCDPRRLRDLAWATRPSDASPFTAFDEACVLPRLRAEAPDVVGVTLTNQQQWLPGLSLARTLRSHGWFVVLGGALLSKFTTALSPEFFELFADAVVAYEGESALLELLDRRARGRDLRGVPNLLYVDRGRVVSNPTHVEDVDTLPTPDFTGLPLDDYLAPARVLPILLGKGCYFNRCRFCDIPFINHVSRKAYRVRSPERVAEDVRALEDRFGARHFVITDEALAPKLLLDLAEALPPDPQGARGFTGYARLEEGFTPAVFETMARFGFRKLFFGMESASPVMIERMNKGTRPGSASRILRDCRAAGIRFHVFSIIGLPEETEEMARQTHRFFVDHREDLDAFGNSFGIKPFTLELRTAYFEERARFGVELRDGAPRGEFVVGLAPEEWTNARGLSHERVRELIRTELGPGLVGAYPRLYGDSYAIWPTSEEYSVLYGSHYRDRPFPYEASIPWGDRARRLTLRLNPSVWTRTDGFSLELRRGERSVTVPRPIIDLVTTPRARTPEELRGELDGSEELSDLLSQLVRAGFMQVAVEAEAPA